MEHQRWKHALDELAGDFVKEHGIPGAVVGLVAGANFRYEGAFGYRDVERQAEVTPDTVFGIASVTKSVTCAAVMTLQEAGKLSVHDAVVRYLPELAVSGREWMRRVTIHHLMTHSSGMPPLPSLMYAMKRSVSADPSADDYPGLRIDRDAYEAIETYEQLMAFIAEYPFEPLDAPGAAFSYSNDSYALLGCIVERVSGLPFPDYVDAVILRPAGMERSAFDLRSPKLSGNRTTLYAARASGTDESGPEAAAAGCYAAPVWWEAPAMIGAGFLRSTVRDMLAYMSMYWNEGMVNGYRILNQDSVRCMLHPHVRSGPRSSYGYGFLIVPGYRGTTLVEHSGGLKGISSHLAMMPERKTGSIVLTNVADRPAATLLNGAFNLVLGLPADTRKFAWRAYEADAADGNGKRWSAEYAAEYTGRFISGEGAEAIVEQEGEALVYRAGDRTYRLLPIEERDVFLLGNGHDDTVIRYIRNASGDIVRMASGLRQLHRTGEKNIRL